MTKENVVNPELTPQPPKSPSALEDIKNNMQPEPTPNPTPAPVEPVVEPVVEPEPLEPVVTPEPTPTPPAPGDKTPPNLLLKSLQEEKEKRRELEQEKADLVEQVKQLENSSSDNEVFSDEGKALLEKIKGIEGQLAETKNENAKLTLLKDNPILEEHYADFETYRALPENKGMALETAAKAFIIDNMNNVNP